MYLYQGHIDEQNSSHPKGVQNLVLEPHGESANERTQAQSVPMVKGKSLTSAETDKNRKE